MVRCIVTIIISFLIVLSGAIYENLYIKKTFEDFHVILYEVQSKMQQKTAKTDDILSIQKFWLNKKKTLHAFILHTEIKEIDLWISECITYTKYEKYEDAEAKLEVVIELSEQIPKNFLIKLENIF